MSKVFWKGSTILAPVPAVLVSCGTVENPKVLTIGWTGIVNTHPPMTYISVRPERHSYNIIKNSGEFVINLTTSAICRQTDFCGVRSGKNTDKFKECGFHAMPCRTVSAPCIEECPINLECKITDSKHLGTHTMYRQQGQAQSSAMRSYGIRPRRIFCTRKKTRRFRIFCQKKEIR